MTFPTLPCSALLAAMLTFLTFSPALASTVNLDRHYTDKSPLIKRTIGDWPPPSPLHHGPQTPNIDARIVEYGFDDDMTIHRRGDVPPSNATTGSGGRTKRADSSVGLNIDVSGGIAYTFEVLVGKNQVPVPILVDTGSADLWVPSTNCPNCTKDGMTNPGISYAEGCKVHEKGYGSGSVHGCLVTTDVTIGDYHLNDYSLLAVQDSYGFDGKYMSGIFGLAGNQLAIDGRQTPMDLMLSGGMISSPEVGFFLARQGDGSELVFGNPHSSPHANADKKVTLQRTDDGALYRLTLDAFVAHGQQITDAENGINMQNIEVIIDTGTSDIRIPEELMLPIYASMGKGSFFKDPGADDNYVVPCDGYENSDETFGLQFGGQTFYMKWQDLVSGPSSTDPNFCNLRIAPSPVDGYLIVGNNFLRNTYHVVNVQSGEVTFYGLKE